MHAAWQSPLSPPHSCNNNNLKQFRNFHHSNITELNILSRRIHSIRDEHLQDWRHHNHVSNCQHLVMISERKHCKCTVAKTLLVSRFLRNMYLSTTTLAAAQSVHCISLLNVLQVRFGKIGYWQLREWGMRLGPAPSYECTISAQCISVCRIFTVCTFYALITSREDHAPINIDGSSPEWSEWLS